MLKQNRKVYLADTDATGFVYYARYLEWTEAARLDFLEMMGTNLEELQKAGHSAVVKEVTVSFQAPIRLEETITIETSLKEVTRTSVVFSYTFTNQVTSRKAGSGEVTVIFINTATLRPARIPESISTSIQQYIHQHEPA